MSVDPAMRQVVGGRAKERTAASTSLMGRFETEIHTRHVIFQMAEGLVSKALFQKILEHIHRLKPVLNG